ncbi:MAG TPA: hypothetical protein VM146_00665 [Steroidobacteraceae bacterium]|nr:hypothetical protein [Steroidobacteraceae bacterium]
MLRFILIACLLIAPAAHAARPKLVHQTQTLAKPAGYYYFGYEIALDGDWALIAAATASPPTGQTQRHDALLYHFVNGQWTFDRVLATRSQIEGGTLTYFRSLAMSNGLAAIGSNPTQVFKRTNNTWAEISHPFTAPVGDPDHVEGALVWDGNTLLAEKSTCDAARWGARISTLQTDGSWTPLQRITGDDDCVLRPRSWAISGDTVVAGTVTQDPETKPSQMRIFRRGGATWQLTSSVPDGGIEADVRGNEIFFDVGGAAGTRVYRNDDTLTLVDRLRTVSDSSSPNYPTFGLTHSSDVVVRDSDVFRKNVSGKYEHVARLVTRGDSQMRDDLKISGRRVLSKAVLHMDSSFPVVMYHELPATYTPSPVITTGFTNGTAPFTPVIGSFAVATTPTGNRVYRQSSVNGEYRALLNYSDWQEQSIEADINPMALGDYNWAGLAVRHLDGANYYYVAVRSSGRIALNMMRNGERTQLREVQIGQTGTNRHVALQALNRTLRVLVDGKEVIWYVDATPIPHGSAALVGSDTAADYDNVVAAQVGQNAIFDLEQYGWCNGSLVYTNFYTVTGSGSWSCNDDDNGISIMRQTSTADIARVVIPGLPTDDQVVGSRARLTAVNGSDRWIGIIARYVDANNYYYLTLRGSNTVSLRKVVNGVATVLVTANLPVTLNTWYDLRLDAVGNELRAFVNNRQVLQTTDASHPVGRPGMLTYKAGAEFSNFISWQP